MKKLKAFVRDYLTPKNKVFIINQPRDEVNSAIENIRSSSSILSDLDFELKDFTGEQFLISLNRLGWRLPYPSIIIGIISINNELQVVINCKRKSNLLGIIFIFLSLFSGCVYLFRFFFMLQEIKELGFGFLFLTVLPYLAMWYSIMTEEVLYKRFEVYLKKRFNKK